MARRAVITLASFGPDLSRPPPEAKAHRFQWASPTGPRLPPRYKGLRHRTPCRDPVALLPVTVSLSGKQGCSIVGPLWYHSEHFPVAVPKKSQLSAETSDIFLQ